MMMVELYEMLPQLQYQGKYPNSMVSPYEPKQHTPPQDEPSSQENVFQNGANPENAESKKENGTSKEDNGDSKEDESTKSSNLEDSPVRPHSSIPSPRDERGRSPRRKIDSYVPRRDSRSSGRRRSNSRGRRDSYNQYLSPEKRRRAGDSYSHDYPSKRRGSIQRADYESPERKKTSDSGEMSEGEIR
jgi:hypothetical protein